MRQKGGPKELTMTFGLKIIKSLAGKTGGNAENIDRAGDKKTCGNVDCRHQT